MASTFENQFKLVNAKLTETEQTMLKQQQGTESKLDLILAGMAALRGTSPKRPAELSQDSRRQKQKNGEDDDENL